MNNIKSFSFQAKKFTRANIIKDWRQNRTLYWIILPVVLYFFVFCYLPMFGMVIAFQNYSPSLGVLNSEWVGLQNFKDFFGSYFFGRLMVNTLRLSLLDLIVGFPAPIILALLLNEVNNRWFKSTLQTVSYMPYFLSLMVVCSLISDFCNPGGAIQSIVQKITGNELGLLSQPEMFPAIYVLSNVWQGVGFQSIIYLAAIAGIDQEQYEAARIDGAGRWRQALCITPVSYTHLQFFLRQRNRRTAQFLYKLQCGDQCIVFQCAAEDAELDGISAVSYTHLDVYKRQLLHHFIMTLCTAFWAAS